MAFFDTFLEIIHELTFENFSVLCFMISDAERTPARIIRDVKTYLGLTFHIVVYRVETLFWTAVLQVYVQSWLRQVSSS